VLAPVINIFLLVKKVLGMVIKLKITIIFELRSRINP
jgi:hypothetical protein